MYAYSFNEELYNSDEFNTVEDALQAAKKEVADSTPTNELPCFVWIGEIGKFEPVIDADDVMERLQEQACEECGECSEAYLDSVSKQETNELSEMLTGTFHKWEKKHHQEPQFHPIENVQEFVIGDE